MSGVDHDLVRRVDSSYREEARKFCERFHKLRPDESLIYAAMLYGAALAIGEQLTPKVPTDVLLPALP